MIETWKTVPVEATEEMVDLSDALTMSKRHSGLGDYVEAALFLQRGVENFLAAAPTPAPSADGVSWRCFHCDETFTDEAAARQHFGPSCDCEPICGVTAERYREVERLLQEYRTETDATSREFYALGAEHYQKERAAEQKGYDRGLQDAKDHPEELGLALASQPAPVDGVREAHRRDLVKSGADTETLRLATAVVSRIEAEKLERGVSIAIVQCAILDGMAWTQTFQHRQAAWLHTYRGHVAGMEMTEASTHPFRKQDNTISIEPLYRAALASQPAPVDGVRDDAIRAVWTAAMTAACNIVIKRQNDLNADDGSVEVMQEQQECIDAIKRWLQPDLVFMEELREIANAALAAPKGAPAQGDTVSEIIELCRRHAKTFRANGYALTQAGTFDRAADMLTTLPAQLEAAEREKAEAERLAEYWKRLDHTHLGGMNDALARAEAAEARAKEAVEARDKANRLATDRQYMLDAYHQMLGPKGLEVAAMWKAKGVIRQHTSWGPEAAKMTGEQRAQCLLDTENAPSRIVTNLDEDCPSEALAARASREGGEPRP